MAIRQTKKISELPALSPASLDTTFVVGISGSTTYKISINQLTSSLDTTFATDLVTATLSSSLDGKLSTSSFNQYTASISTASLVTSITNLNSYTATQDAVNIAFTNGINGRLTTSSFNSYTASQSTSSLVSRLNTIESVSGSWITESETGSFLTSLSGAISSSSQLTSSYDTRYTLSGSIQPLPSNLLSSSAQITAFGFISSSATIPAGTISGSSQLTTAFPSKTTGAWSVPAGASTQSFTVEAGASYTMWVNGNIPNGIITWNATVTTSNTNVPAVGSQYGWYYTAGNALVLTAMPDQIIGTSNTLISSPASYTPNTSNVFKFGITNNTLTTQTINYGYIKLS
jgi:hypothetical protein